MKTLKKHIVEGLLAGQGETLSNGDRYNNVTLDMIIQSKSHDEFYMLCELLKYQIEKSKEKEPELLGNYRVLKHTKPSTRMIIAFGFKDYAKEYSLYVGDNKNGMMIEWSCNRTWVYAYKANKFSDFYFDIRKDNFIRFLPKSMKNDVIDVFNKYGRYNK
jgi:hypothetical protein